MCCTRGSLKYRMQKIAKKSPSAHHSTTLWGYIFATEACNNSRKKLLTGNIFFICLHNMVNLGSLTAEICWRVWGTPANFNGFRVLPSLLQRRRSLEANQTVHDVWSSPRLVHYIHFRELLLADGILPRGKFTLRPSLAFSFIVSVRPTARHASSERQPTAAWSKEWNYITFAENDTCIRQGGYHVGHRPTF